MIRRIVRAALLAMSLVLASSGCATVIHGTTQKVEIVTKPPGATARVLPEGTVVTTPGSVVVPRKKAHTVRVELAGYCSETIYLDRLTSGAVHGNLLLGGIIGLSVDVSDGAAFVLVPETVDVTLRPATTAVEDSGCD